MKLKRVIHLLAEIKFSGAEVMLKLSADYFQDRNIELHALAVGSSVGDYAHVLEKSGFTIHHFPNNLSLGYFGRIYKFFKENKFDAVHMHFEGAFFWYATAIFFANPSVKIVRTVHNVFPYQGYLRFRRSLQRFICRNIYGVEFVSIGSSVAEVEKKVLANTTTYVPNWIDFEKYPPLVDENEKTGARNQLSLPLNAVVMISVGASTHIKNHKDILLALSKINDKFDNFYYLHVGDGPLQKTLKELAKSLHLESKVKFIGQLKNVREALIASDIYVMPSHHEGLSISLLEAMTVGLPSVVYNSYGLKDLITDEVNGFIVEKNDQALSEGLLKLLEDKKRREQFGANARKYILEKYDMKKSLDKLISMYFSDHLTDSKSAIHI